MINFPGEEYEKMLDWLRLGLPNEACGLLAGVWKGADATVKKVYGMKNVDESPVHFSMDAEEQLAVIKDIRKNGWALIGNVHSHPASCAEPSEEDKRLAYDGSILYLICSFQEKEPVLKAYRIENQKKISEVKIRYI